MCSRNKNGYSEYAALLIINGIYNMSFNPDVLGEGMKTLLKHKHFFIYRLRPFE